MRRDVQPLSPHDAGVRIGLFLFGGIGVVVALSMPVAILVFLWGAFVADSRLYVHHDGHGVVEVIVDGQELATLRDAGAVRLPLPRGDHEVVLRGADTDQSFVLDGVSGLDEWMLRTNPDNCFAVVDVTRVVYDRDTPCEHLDAARITCFYRRFPKREAGSPTFRADDLPTHPGRLETLWLDFPCDRDPTAEELLREELGCP